MNIKERFKKVFLPYPFHFKKVEPKEVDPAVTVNFNWDKLSTQQIEIISRLSGPDMQPVLKLVLAMMVNGLGDELTLGSENKSMEDIAKKTLYNAGIRQGFNRIIWLGEDARVKLKERMPNSQG